MFFDLNDAASIGIIGAADGPTAIVVSQKAQFGLSGSYNGGGVFVYGCWCHNSAAVIKLLTTKKERLIRMPYHDKKVSKLTKILFPSL